MADDDVPDWMVLFYAIFQIFPYFSYSASYGPKSSIICWVSKTVCANDIHQVWKCCDAFLWVYWPQNNSWPHPQYSLARYIKMEASVINSILGLSSFVDYLHQIWASSDERPQRSNLLYVLKIFSKWWKYSIGGNGRGHRHLFGSFQGIMRKGNLILERKT